MNKFILALIFILILGFWKETFSQPKVPYTESSVKTLLSGDSLHYFKPKIKCLYNLVDFINIDTASIYHPDSLRIDVLTSQADTLYNVDFKVWVGADADERYAIANMILLTEGQIKSVLILSPDVAGIRVRWVNVAVYPLRKVKTVFRTITF